MDYRINKVEFVMKTKERISFNIEDIESIESFNIQEFQFKYSFEKDRIVVRKICPEFHINIYSRGNGYYTTLDDKKSEMSKFERLSTCGDIIEVVYYDENNNIVQEFEVDWINDEICLEDSENSLQYTRRFRDGTLCITVGREV